MLYHSSAPQTPRSMVFQCTPFEPPAEVETPEEYVGWLRALYRRDPGRFVRFVREVRDGNVTIVESERPEFVQVLYNALVAVAATKGWHIAGGELLADPHPYHRR